MSFDTDYSEMNESNFNNLSITQKRDMIMQQVRQQTALQSAQSMLQVNDS